MKRRTHPVQKTGQSPWRKYNKGKGGEAGSSKRILTPQCMWVDRYIETKQEADDVALAAE